MAVTQENVQDVLTARLAKQAQEAEQQSLNVQSIFNLVNKAREDVTALDIFSKRLDGYNAAVQRVSTLEQLVKHKIEPFEVKDVQEGFFKEVHASYSKEKLQEDFNNIQIANEELTKLSVNGYKTIMALREKVTHQKIAYAVRNLDGTTKAYDLYLEEEDFVNLLSSKPRYAKYTKVKTIGKNFTGASLNINFSSKDLLKDDPQAVFVSKSTDFLYKGLSRFIGGQKSVKLRPSAAWEVYSEARLVFGTQNPIKYEVLREFVVNWLTRGKMKYSTFDKEVGEGRVASLSSLRFYQGGDTASSSQYVMYQNKQVQKDREASVSIKTIYNGLKNILEVFDTGGRVNEKYVIQLFTADFSNTVAEIGEDAFFVANKYAQEQIQKTIKELNASMGFR